jgi:hypothetical protein
LLNLNICGIIVLLALHGFKMSHGETQNRWLIGQNGGSYAIQKKRMEKAAIDRNKQKQRRRGHSTGSKEIDRCHWKIILKNPCKYLTFFVFLNIAV